MTEYNDEKSYKAIHDICEELRTTKIHQIHTHLAEFDENNKIIGKCALGVLCCKFYETITPNNIMNMWYNSILSATGLDDGFCNNIPLIHSNFIEENLASTLDGAIFCLNDNGFSFKEIADFLETTFIPESRG